MKKVARRHKVAGKSLLFSRRTISLTRVRPLFLKLMSPLLDLAHHPSSPTAFPHTLIPLISSLPIPVHPCYPPRFPPVPFSFHSWPGLTSQPAVLFILSGLMLLEKVPLKEMTRNRTQPCLVSALPVGCQEIGKSPAVVLTCRQWENNKKGTCWEGESTKFDSLVMVALNFLSAKRRLVWKWKHSWMSQCSVLRNTQTLEAASFSSLA